MSGAAGARIQTEWYDVELDSGISISPAAMPGEDPSLAVGRYFERANKPFEAWLERARPRLDALFADIAASGRLPVAPYRPDAPYLYASIVEDVVEESTDPGRVALRKQEERERLRWAERNPDTLVSVELSGSRFEPVFFSFRLRMTVKGSTRRSALQLLEGEVATLFASTAQVEPEPEPDLSPKPVVVARPPGLLRRLWRVLRRS